MASPLVQIAFYYLAAASVASAILAVTRRNPVHSILWVLALFLHVAGVFLIVGSYCLRRRYIGVLSLFSHAP